MKRFMWSPGVWLAFNLIVGWLAAWHHLLFLTWTSMFWAGYATAELDRRWHDQRRPR